MTGKAAVIWKLRYIEAFNALEGEALENHAELAREAGYMQGKEETLCLAVMEAERRKGYLAGLKEGQKFRASRDGLQILKKILDYRQRGLSYREIGRLLGIGKSAVGERLKRATAMGVIPQKLEKGHLQEVCNGN